MASCLIVFVNRLCCQFYQASMERMALRYREFGFVLTVSDGKCKEAGNEHGHPGDGAEDSTDQEPI